MVEYKISKKEVEVFSASRQTDKNITEFNLEKKKEGWMVKVFRYNVDSAWPKEDIMFLPNDIIENIILKEHVKKQLKK